MEIPKPTQDDRDRFTALVPDDPRVAVKPMFGNLGAYVNGNMFMGLFGPDVGVKLDNAARDELLAAGGGAFGPIERPMASYVALPPKITRPKAKQWVAKSLDYVGSLPPKPPKPKKAPESSK